MNRLVQEITAAENFWMKKAQQESFPDKISAFSKYFHSQFCDQLLKNNVFFVNTEVPP